MNEEGEVKKNEHISSIAVYVACLSKVVQTRFFTGKSSSIGDKSIFDNQTLL